MAFHLFKFTSRLNLDEYPQMEETHFVNSTHHLPFSESSLNEYRTFLRRIYYRTGLDLSEVNNQTGWFFAPDDFGHVSHTTVRALWKLLGDNDIQANRGKALRKAIKDYFEAKEREAEASGTEPPKKMGVADVRAMSEGIAAGRIRLRKGMSKYINTARIGEPFSTMGYVKVPR